MARSYTLMAEFHASENEPEPTVVCAVCELDVTFLPHDIVTTSGVDEAWCDGCWNACQ